MTPDEKIQAVTVSIPSRALESIFNECDRYDNDETGGRIIGVFRTSDDGSLEIEVTGVIEAGSKARRSRSSFFQDGDYQAQVFRRLEASHPDLEHLGNWHTHHVNSFPSLSPGDIKTYNRIVNHEKHNHHFFYALLVVAKSPLEQGLSRYRIRHYILFRGGNEVYEIESPNVIVTQKPIVWPTDDSGQILSKGPMYANEVRAKDGPIISEFYPTLRPYWSKRANTFYWKGTLDLIDSSSVEITVPEMSNSLEDGPSYYLVIMKNVPQACTGVMEEFALRQFESATQAVRALEKQMNSALYLAINQRSCE